jgi:hypothetical protein
MMFYNGFNLLIDILLVSGAAFYVRWRTMRDNKLIDMHTLDYEYNEGWEAGYKYGKNKTRYGVRYAINAKPEEKKREVNK